MLSLLFLAMAAPAASPPAQVESTMEHQLETQGPMPAENYYLLPGRHKDDDAMYPDLAIKDLRIDGDTLYVLVKNEGALQAQGPVRLVARAEIGTMTSDPAFASTAALGKGESRWVPVRGFSVKAASTAATVFALENATAVAATVSASAGIPGALNRTGQGCDRCSSDLNPANNSLALAAPAIRHGRPQ